PDFALELHARVTRHGLVRACIRRVNEPVAPLDDICRDHEVVCYARRDWLKQRPPYGIHRAGRRDGVARAAADLLEILVEVPVQLLANPAQALLISGQIALVAGHAAYLRVGKWTYEGAQRIGRVHAVSIRKDENFPLCLAGSRVESRNLPPTRQRQQPDAAL